MATNYTAYEVLNKKGRSKGTLPQTNYTAYNRAVAEGRNSYRDPAPASGRRTTTTLPSIAALKVAQTTKPTIKPLPGPPALPNPMPPRPQVGAPLPPPMPIMPDFTGVGDALAAAQAQAVDALAGLESAYQAELKALQGLYQLAETPQEKAQLQFMLENLEAQKEAGQEVVKKSYNEAIRGSEKSSKSVEKRGKESRKEVQADFTKAAEQARELVDSSEAQFRNEALGLGEGVSGGAADVIIANLMDKAAEAGQFAEQMDLAQAGEIAAMTESLRGQEAAQQAELQRIAASLAAQTQLQHNLRVGDRIAAERRALANAQIGLSQAYTNRAWSLQDQLNQIAMQGVGLQQDAAMTQANLQNQYARDAWQSAEQARQIEEEAQRQWMQQRFELEAERQALEYERDMQDYLRSQQQIRANRLMGLEADEFAEMTSRAQLLEALGLPPELALR